MPEQITDKNEAAFIQLIAGLQGSAWMLMGKVANPVTGKIEKNLEAAKTTIDTLIMIQEKTKGNLSQIEDDYLRNTISQLQLNFVKEKESLKKE